MMFFLNVLRIAVAFRLITDKQLFVEVLQKMEKNEDSICNIFSM